MEQASAATSMIFGTYRLKNPELTPAVQQAYRMGFRHFDTAQLYQNEADLAAALPDAEFPGCTFTTKIRTKQLKKIDKIIEWVRERTELFGGRLTTVLLHRPMNRHIVWQGLEECVRQGLITTIGVSNFTKYHIMEILQHSTLAVKPMVNQLEYHPFFRDEEAIGMCRENGILMQAHTVMCRGELLGHGLDIGKTHGVRPCEVFLAYARQTLGDCGVPVISSTSEEHLAELLHAESSLQLTAEEIGYLNSLSEHPIQYIKTENPIELIRTMEPEKFVNKIVEELRFDLEHPDALTGAAVRAPTYAKLNKPMIAQISAALWPQNEGETEDAWKTRAKANYRRIIPQQRRDYAAQQKQAKEARDAEINATGKNKQCCCAEKRWMNTADGSISSEAITTPTPMPVAVPDHYELEPMLNFLKDQHQTTSYPIRFRKGSMFEDGRMDMCKQVIGPYMNELCDAVKSAEIEGVGGVQHFLLGNNIAFYDQSKRELGQDALAELMATTKTIQTWYLAGNYIDATMCEKMYNSLKDSQVVRNVWLKRNPIGAAGARHVGKLIGANPNIITLDMHNTGMMDEGCRTFTEGFLETRGETTTLRHLYMDANGISAEGARALVPFFEAHKHVLESLFVSLNPLKDEGAEIVINSLRGSTSLKRICLGSDMVTIATLQNICGAIGQGEFPSLVSCDMGFYKSTYDMGVRPNLFVETKATKKKPNPAGFEKVMEALAQLPENGPLQYFSLEKSGLGDTQSQQALEALKSAHGIPNVNCKQWHWATDYSYDMNEFDLRRVRQPMEVDYIESIYRNAM